MRERVAWFIVVVLAVVVGVLVFRDRNPRESPVATTTTVPVTTTVATTTTVAATTTTPSTTTTVVEPTTTTLAPGAWADQPLIVASFGALGWWDGSGWVQVEPTTPLPVVGGEDYRVVLGDSDAIVTGSPPVAQCEPLDNPGVDLDDPDAVGTWPGPHGVAVSAPWETNPRPAQTLAASDTYREAARDLLAGQGIFVDDPEVVQVLRFDLEGDGVNEVLVVAESITGPGVLGAEGDYSVVFLRRVMDGGDVQTAILGLSVIDDPESGPYILSFRVAAVADLNGDDRLEVVLSGVYYEGAGVEVWEYLDDDLGPVRQLTVGCGA